MKMCEALHFRGNIAGAWREFDADFGGFITLEEAQPAAFQLARPSACESLRIQSTAHAWRGASFTSRGWSSHYADSCIS